MRRICRYFSKAANWRGRKNVKWIVCKKCKREAAREIAKAPPALIGGNKA